MNTDLISILGAGESGVGAALLAKAKGFNVFVSDKGTIADKYKTVLIENSIDFEEGNHNLEIILTSREVVKSPGIPHKVEIIQLLKKANIAVISEIEFAARYTSAKLIGITGSNGKTTTTLFTYHILKKLGLKIGLAGNIGDSFAKQVISDSFDYYVLELSSFQLDDVLDFHPHIAVILNITPDHLDRYDYNFHKYVTAKFNIAQNLTSSDFLIFWDGDIGVKNEIIERNIAAKVLDVSMESANSFAYSDGTKIKIRDIDGNQTATIEVEKLPIKGQHNQINSMSAFAIASALGLDINKLQDASQDFKNANHRLERIRVFNDVTYINDSKATNVDSVYYALDSIDAPIVLIAGGVDKGNDYNQIAELVTKKVKAIVCMGVDNSKLKSFFEGKVKLVETSSLQEAINAANELAVAGDTVLLSPACASFDLFKNYEDRGNQFKQAVLDLN